MLIEHKKNTAFELAIPMVDSATPASFKTGLTVGDAAYYKDGAGAWTSLAITDTFAEIGTTGIYEISLTAGEMNHDWIIIKATATGAADTFVTFRMHTNDIDGVSTFDASSDTVDVGKISGDATAADNLEADYDGTGYAKTSSTIGTATAVTDDVGITQAGADKVADAVWNETRADHKSAGSAGQAFIQILAATAVKRIIDNKNTGETKVYDEDGTTLLYTLEVQNGATDAEVELKRV